MSKASSKSDRKTRRLRSKKNKYLGPPKQEPTHLPQITELHQLNIKALLPAIHVFNSLVLDEQLRWYSEELTRDYWLYFFTQEKYDAYMSTVNNKPMDFTTIKVKIFALLIFNMLNA